MQLLNLDKLVPDDKKILLCGLEWVIPGEVPVKIMLDIMKTSQELDNSENEDVNSIEKAFKPLYDVFKIRNKDLTFEKFIDMISLSQYAKIVQFILSSFNEVEEKKTTEELENKIMMQKEGEEVKE